MYIFLFLYTSEASIYTSLVLLHDTPHILLYSFPLYLILNDSIMIKLQKASERIKFARYLTGLDRKEVEQRFSINYNTLQSWELERNPLSLRGAEKLSKAFLSEGVLCSTAWLLTGEGSLPSFITNCDNALHTEMNIFREIESFKTINPDPIVTLISDNSMYPLLEIGDYVGGTRLYSDQILELSGKVCVIETTDGVTLVKKLLYSSSSYSFNLISFDLDSEDEPILLDVKIASAAEVVWIRKQGSVKSMCSRASLPAT